MAKMTILRARRELEMDVDIDETTEVANVDYVEDKPNEGILTVYGTESEDGKLWYITLDQDAIEQILLSFEAEGSSMKLLYEWSQKFPGKVIPTMPDGTTNFFQLGIDLGYHDIAEAHDGK